MTIRLFSKKHGLYTNSPFWPSNQRSFSDWALSPNGEIIEIVSLDGERSSSYVTTHDPRTFEVEAWTGYFDSAGKKIYRGDILEMFSVFDFVSEVVWKDGAFWTKALDKEGSDSQLSPYLTPHWRIKGNIHGVEYND